MREPVIGIDLGTTYSAVAVMEEGRPRIIPNRAGLRLTPSMIAFTRAGDRVVGEAARLLLEEIPENVAYATKRFIGRRWTEALVQEARSVVPYPLVAGPNGEVRVQIAGRVMPLPQISAMVLGELKLDAQVYFGRPVTKAVITVPANFDDGQRQATKEAASIAGLEVLRIVNEPTAAAIAYGLQQKFEGRTLVFDLGGGTFDVSILEVERGVFQVRATGGDPRLGGEDFDSAIAQWLLAQVPEGMRQQVSRDVISMQHLKVAGERAKRTLTDHEEAYISVVDLGDHLEAKKFTELNTSLTRQFFEQLSEPFSKRCMAVCEQVMKEAQLSNAQLDQVLLVGGMTRVPMIRRLVQDFFAKQPNTSMNPDEVVALGAAVHAAELGDQGGTALLIDVASHSLGVGVLGGKVRRLVQKNTSIPVSTRETFLPGRIGQTEARIPIFQGEGDKVEECSKLGELSLKDLQGGHRADHPIEVTFELTVDGTLSVHAKDIATGQERSIRIDARTELQKGEVDRLKREEGDYAVVAEKDARDQASDNFSRLLERGEKLAKLLQRSADENPSPEATSAVASVRSLLDLGRAALRAGSPEQMAEISKRFNKLLTGTKD
jgi:molecular chaperone DnaK